MHTETNKLVKEQLGRKEIWNPFRTRPNLHIVKAKSLKVIERVSRASLVAQWLGIRLLMQGTRVHAPVREDPTCRGAAGPVGHNY